MSLNQRQLEILRMVDLGLPHKAIATVLGISIKGVHWHVGKLHNLTGTRCAVQLMRWGIEHGFLPEIRRNRVVNNVK